MDNGRSGADAPSGSQASPAAPSGSAPSVSIPNAIEWVGQPHRLFSLGRGTDGLYYGARSSPPSFVVTADTEAEAQRKAGAAIEAYFVSAAAQYRELIFAVASKHPGETRHETALRYLREREQASAIEAASADETRSGSAVGESAAPEGGDAQ